MILQSKEAPFRGVSFSPKLHEQFDSACSSKSSVKLQKYRLVPNRFNPNVQDVQINQLFTIQATEVSFPHSLLRRSVANKKSVKKMQMIAKDKDVVSCTLFLSVRHRSVVTTSSPYHNNPVLKKEIYGNDKDTVIKVVLWDDKINDVKEDGVYDIENATLRSYPNGGHVVNVGKGAMISTAKDDKDITRLDTHNMQEAHREISFPPISIHLIKHFICITCKKDVELDKSCGKTMACPICGMTVSAEKCEIFYSAKLTVPEVVNMFRFQVQLYYDKRGMTLPTDENTICMDMLQDDKTIILVNGRNTCIGFKKNF